MVDVSPGELGQLAKEQTLRDLLNATKQGNALLISVAKEKGVSTAELQKNLNAVERSAGGAAVGINKFSDNSNKVATSLDTVGQVLGQKTNLLDAAVGGLGEGMHKAAAAIKNPALRGFVEASLAAGGAIGSAAQRALTLSQGLSELYNTGLSFDQGLQGMVISASKLNLDVGKLSRVMATHAGVVANLGTAKFVELGQQATKMTGEFARLGITTPEAIQESVASYAEVLRSTGRLQSLSTEGLAQGALKYQNELEQAAQASGRRREDLARDHKSFMEERDTQAYAMTLSGKALSDFTAATAGMPKLFGESANAMNSQINAYLLGGRSYVNMNERFTSMLQRAQATAEFEQLANATAANDQVAMSKASQALKARLEAFGHSMAGVPVAGELKELQGEAAVLLASMNKLGGATGGAAKPLDETAAKVLQLNGTIEGIRDQLGNVTDGFVTSGTKYVTGLEMFDKTTELATEGLFKMGTMARYAAGDNVDADAIKSMGEEILAAGSAAAVMFRKATRPTEPAREGGGRGTPEGTGRGSAEGGAGRREPGAGGGGGRMSGAGRAGAGLSLAMIGDWLEENNYPTLGAALKTGGGALAAEGAMRVITSNRYARGAAAVGAGLTTAYLERQQLFGTGAEAADTANAAPTTSTISTPSTTPQGAGSAEAAIVEQLMLLNQEMTQVLDAIKEQTRTLDRSISTSGNTVN